MVIESEKTKRLRSNLWLTDEQVRVIWREAENFGGLKWKTQIGFQLWRGLRALEMLNIHIKDLKNGDFDKIDIVTAKTKVLREQPLFKEFSEVVKLYVERYHHTFIDGYLFPGERGGPMKVTSYCARWSKFRKYLIKKYPEMGYQERTEHGKYRRWHISSHSCRRWFETKIYEDSKDLMELMHIMNYSDVKPVKHYINAYEYYKNERGRLKETFGGVFNDFAGFEVGQTRLNDF